MLEYTCISKSFNGKKVVDNFNLTIERGNRIALKGESGRGKTTILNILSGMLKADYGHVLYNGENVSFNDLRPEVVAYMPCGDTLLESLTAKENILYARSKKDCRYTRDLMNEWAKYLKVNDVLNSYPRELSSGEYKRICLIRAFVQSTPFVFLDEPTSNLDPESANLVINALMNRDFLFKNVGILIATHDQELLSRMMPEEVIDV